MSLALQISALQGFKSLTHPIGPHLKALLVTLLPVLTLETLMGRHPGDLISFMSSSSSSSLSASCSSSATFNYLLVEDPLDMRLPSPMRQTAAEVVSIVKVAPQCLHASPQSRPSIQQVSQELSTLSPPSVELFHTIKLSQLLDSNSYTFWN